MTEKVKEEKVSSKNSFPNRYTLPRFTAWFEILSQDLHFWSLCVCHFLQLHSQKSSVVLEVSEVSSWERGSSYEIYVQLWRSVRGDLGLKFLYPIIFYWTFSLLSLCSPNLHSAVQYQESGSNLSYWVHYGHRLNKMPQAFNKFIDLFLADLSDCP